MNSLIEAFRVMIAFLFNARGPGGIQSLVIRVAQELTRRALPCLVMDFPWGFVWKALESQSGDGLRLASLEGRKYLDDIVPDEAVLISFNAQEHIFSDRFRHKDPRLLIWDVYPPYWETGFMRPSFPLIHMRLARLRWIERSRQAVARIIAEKGGLLTMDETGLGGFQTVSGVSMGLGRILPVPVPVAASPRGRRQTRRDTISACYIGRAAQWKVMPARKVIQDFLSEKRMHLTVVTDSASHFQKLLNPSPDQHLRIKFVEGTFGPRLEQLLIEEADICFGMGTCCLEAARFGIPTVVVDFVQGGGELPADYGYRWLYKEKRTCLGRNVAGCARVAGMTASSIVRQLVNEADEVGARCWEHVRSRFSVTTITDQLIKACSASRLRVSDFRGNLSFSITQVGRWVAKLRRWDNAPESRYRDWKDICDHSSGHI